MSSKQQPPQPYFNAAEPFDLAMSAGPNMIFVTFLTRLEGAAQVKIDTRQEMLLMNLRALVLKHAMSERSARIVLAVNQLCAIYAKTVGLAGEKLFEVFGEFLNSYTAIQEQIFLARDQAKNKEQRPVAQASNLLHFTHELIENSIRQLATFGTYCLDAIEQRNRATRLTAQKYLDLAVADKERTFDGSPYVLSETHRTLFGSVDRGIRNSIAHRRYSIDDDGAVTLHDFDPRTNIRRLVGKLTPDELEQLAEELQVAVDTFEISILIFQHNNAEMLNELGIWSCRHRLANSWLSWKGTRSTEAP